MVDPVVSVEMSELLEMLLRVLLSSCHCSSRARFLCHWRCWQADIDRLGPEGSRGRDILTSSLDQSAREGERVAGMENVIFTNSAPLGRVGHRVAMSVCVSVCLSLPSRNTHFRRSCRPLVEDRIPNIGLG